MPSRRTKLGVRKAMRLVEHFVAETTARTAADLVGVNKATTALFYRKIREVIARRMLEELPHFLQ